MILGCVTYRHLSTALGEDFVDKLIPPKLNEIKFFKNIHGYVDSSWPNGLNK